MKLRGTALGKTYATPRGDVAALADVDLTVDAGELIVLAGQNGSGKSTLLAVLAGVVAPTRGDVELLGVRAPAGDAGARTRLQSRIAFVEQDLTLDPEMTANETLRLFAALYRVPRAAVDEAVTRFGLAPFLDRVVARTSGGQRRRLHLACALLHVAAAEVIFADEPTAGLDAEGSALVWALFAERARAGAAIIVATHELETATEHCTRVVNLLRGKLVT